MSIIKSPNTEFTGVSASVYFTNGVGETDDQYLIDWFKAHGYTVEQEKPKAKPAPK